MRVSFFLKPELYGYLNLPRIERRCEAQRIGWTHVFPPRHSVARERGSNHSIHPRIIHAVEEVEGFDYGADPACSLVTHSEVLSQPQIEAHETTLQDD